MEAHAFSLISLLQANRAIVKCSDHQPQTCIFCSYLFHRIVLFYFAITSLFLILLKPQYIWTQLIS